MRRRALVPKMDSHGDEHFARKTRVIAVVDGKPEKQPPCAVPGPTNATARKDTS